jgi:CRISPR-associated protein Cmr6
MSFPLPTDTAEMLASGIGQNPGLALDKYRQVGPDWKITDGSKKRADIPQPVATLISKAIARHKEMLKSLTDQPRPYFEATTDYRLVVGFGAEHVLETNLYLHRIYGFPIIPGSAVKGVARAYAFWEIARHLELTAAEQGEIKRREKADPKIKTPLTLLDELLADGAAEGLAPEQLKEMRKRQGDVIAKLKKDDLSSPLPKVQQLDFTAWQNLAATFYSVFGTTKRQGQVIFFDAYPTEPPRLEPDILNPHFGDYYGSKDKTKPPADYGSPIPSFFLTVAPNSKFLFAVASRENGLAGKANEWLKGGLTELGIGSKTTAGYGFMKPIS